MKIKKTLLGLCVGSISMLLTSCGMIPNPLEPIFGPDNASKTSTPSGAANNWTLYRKQAALKIMQANKGASFEGRPPDVLASIPVLSVHLNADGSVRGIDVMRTPQAYPQTVAMAKAAILRAAPFGSVTHLPGPLTFNETFLYNYDLKFQLFALQTP
jgi:hypothetical protein